MSGRWKHEKVAEAAHGDMQGSLVDEALQESSINDEMMDLVHNGSVTNEHDATKFKAPWQKLGPDGKKIKHKPNLKKRNAVFRKALQPKTALMCLNELQPGLKFDVEPMAPMGNYTACVLVKDQIYRGYGSCKSSAKQAAAEAALVSFVKPPVGKGEDTAESDDTPWKTIASFAMYKLFANWSESKIATGPNYNQDVPTGNISSGAANMQGGPHNAQQQHVSPDGAHPLKQHLSPAGSALSEQHRTINPAKNMKEELKITSHPVMILHQLMPEVKFEVNEEMSTDGSNSKIFTMTAYVNGVAYSGQGTSVKKAKYHLAKVVLREACGIENTYVLPGASE